MLKNLTQKQRFWLKAIAAVAIVVALGLAFQARWRIGIDPQTTLSMTKRVFLVDIRDPAHERGAFVVFSVENAEPIYSDGTELIKQIAGVPGDTVEITPDFDILVNGRLKAHGLWHLRSFDPEIVRLRFSGKRVLGKDEYWMLGLTYQSFDSRYFGPVKGERIKGRAYAVF